MLKKLRWLLIVPVLILVFFVVMIIKYSGPLSQEELNDKFIKMNPLDLSQIKGFSKYRSCAGHDFRGPLVTTGKKESAPRSMKHYIKVKEELMGKNNVIKAIAPFDGKITNIVSWEEKSDPDDMEIWLTPDNSSKERSWNFIFFHIDLKDDLKKGSKVKAGEIIGTAYMTRGKENSTDNFDMAVKFMRPMKPPAIDIPFAYFDDNVMAEYQKYGATLKNLEISKEYRDQNPCPTTGEAQLGDVFFPATSDPNDFIYLLISPLVP